MESHFIFWNIGKSKTFVSFLFNIVKISLKKNQIFKRGKYADNTDP